MEKQNLIITIGRQYGKAAERKSGRSWARGWAWTFMTKRY